MRYNDSYEGDFYEVIELPDGRIFGDGQLIDRVKPSRLPFAKITRSYIPGACVTHKVTL